MGGVKKINFLWSGVIVHKIVPLKDVSWLIIIMGLFYVEYIKKLHVKGTLYIKKTLKIGGFQWRKFTTPGWFFT